MKNLLFSFGIILVNIGWSQPAVEELKTRKITTAELQADFDLYRRLVQETHPGLYRYTDRDKMQSKLDSISRLLTKPLPFYDFYRLLSEVTADIRCEHSHVFPVKDIEKYLRSDAKMLPFFIFPIQERLYVLFNGTGNQSILPGFELTHINGRPVEQIAATLKRHYWTDGYNGASRSRALQGVVLNLLYYALVERPDSFQLNFIDAGGLEQTVVVPAQTLANTESQYATNPVNNEMLTFYNRKFKKPWRLTFPEDLPATAILRFDAFGGKGMNSQEQARKAIRNFMDKALRKIQKRNTGSVIIDVRGNGGGWDVQGVELVTYLVRSDTAFKYYRRQYTIMDTSEFLQYSDLPEADRHHPEKFLSPESDGTFTLKESGNDLLGLQYPKPNRFRGKVYILMNERSSSTASEFLALAKSHEVGILVGEESSGAYEGGNGSAFIELPLPHSGITVHTPLVAYQNAVRPVPTKGRGTIPHYRIELEPEDLMKNYDRQLEFVKQMIRER